MEVLHICYEYPPIGGGGGEACKKIVEFTSKTGIKNTVLTSWMKGLPVSEKGVNYKINRIYCFRRKRFQCSIFEMFLYLLMAIPFAVYLQAKFNYDLVHIHFAVPCGPVGYLLKLLFGVKYIMTIQGGDVPSFVPEQTEKTFRIIKPFTIPIWKNATNIFAVSKSLAELAELDYPGVELGVIFNGVGDNFFQKKRNEEKIKNIVFAGRLAKQKQVDVLLKALYLIKDNMGWHGHIVGDGPLEDKLKLLANELGLDKRVTFHGWLRQDELLEVLAASHIFVLPSSKEGLPLAGIQAMASGLVLVGSNVEGINDIVVSGQNGFLFKNRDAAALANSIRNLIKNDSMLKEISANGLKEAVKYRWPRIAAKYLEVYKNCSQNESN